MSVCSKLLMEMSRNLGGTAVYSSHMFAHMGFFYAQGRTEEVTAKAACAPRDE